VIFRRKHRLIQAVDLASYPSGSYDGNGNTQWRFRDGQGGQDVFLYDEENRLISATPYGQPTTTYAYDGDGNRVKKVVGGVNTFYVGNWYEVDNGTIVKYYYFGPSTSLRMRVAMNRGGTVTYLHGDHLGSTTVTSNGSGAQVDSQTYYPFGVTRAGSMPTD
jgi:YD repeat-containing protein